MSSTTPGAREPAISVPFTRAQLAGYIRDGVSLACIAEWHLCDPSTVWRWRRRWGLRIADRLRFSDDKWRALILAAPSDRQLAKEIGCSRVNVRAHRIRLGIQTRNPRGCPKGAQQVAA